MSEERPPRPPRVPRPAPGDDDIVHIEDDGPSTEKLRPKFVVPVGRPASIAEAVLQLSALQQQTSAIAVSQTKLLELQRKMALQQDGFQTAVNGRFDVFHQELAMLRATVTGDHGPRLAKAEATLGQKAAKGGGAVALILLAGPMLAEALPKYKWLIDTIVGVFQ